jgi:hypothetical protein
VRPIPRYGAPSQTRSLLTGVGGVRGTHQGGPQAVVVTEKWHAMSVGFFPHSGRCAAAPRSLR